MRARGDEQVCVDDVVEQREEDPHRPERQKKPGHHRRPEADARERRPAEPEKGDGKERCGPEGLFEPVFGWDGVWRKLGHEPFVAWVPDEEVPQAACDAAEEDGEEH